LYYICTEFKKMKDILKILIEEKLNRLEEKFNQLDQILLKNENKKPLNKYNKNG